MNYTRFCNKKRNYPKGLILWLHKRQTWYTVPKLYYKVGMKLRSLNMNRRSLLNIRHLSLQNNYPQSLSKLKTCSCYMNVTISKFAMWTIVPWILDGIVKPYLTWTIVGQMWSISIAHYPFQTWKFYTVQINYDIFLHLSKY